ncbi:MAG: tetratricopeptide repeat protein [Fibrobacterales bacterium]
MITHKVVLHSIAPESDLKRIIIYISALKSSTTNQSIDWVKNLPHPLFTHCSSDTAREVTNQLTEMGGIVVCTPPLKTKKESGVVQPETIKISATKKELKGTWHISFAIIFFLTIIGLAVLVPTIYWAYTSSRSADEKSYKAAKKGTQLIGTKQFDEASTLLRKSIKDNPYNTAPYIAEAMNLMSKARAQMDSTNWSAYGIRNKNSREKGGYGNLPRAGQDRMPIAEATQAIQILKKALKLEPSNPEIYRWLGYIYQQKGLYNNAEMYMRNADSILPTNVLYKNLLGNLYIETEHFSKADYIFREALALDSNNIHTLKNLGFLNQFYLNDTNLAWRYYYKYMQKNPQKQNDFDVNIIKKELMHIVWKRYNTPFFRRGTSEPFKQYESKRRSLQKQLERSNSAETTEKLALLFAKNGKYPEAKNYFQKAIILDNNRTTAYIYLTLLHAAEGELPIAQMMLNKAKDQGSKDPFVYKNLALFDKFYNNNPYNAKENFDKYIRFGADSYKHHLQKEFEDN